MNLLVVDHIPLVAFEKGPAVHARLRALVAIEDAEDAVVPVAVTGGEGGAEAQAERREQGGCERDDTQRGEDLHRLSLPEINGSSLTSLRTRGGVNEKEVDSGTW